jgi:hypothetical protein
LNEVVIPHIQMKGTSVKQKMTSASLMVECTQ